MLIGSVYIEYPIAQRSSHPIGRYIRRILSETLLGKLDLTLIGAMLSGPDSWYEAPLIAILVRKYVLHTPLSLAAEFLRGFPSTSFHEVSSVSISVILKHCSSTHKIETEDGFESCPSYGCSGRRGDEFQWWYNSDSAQIHQCICRYFSCSDILSIVAYLDTPEDCESILDWWLFVSQQSW